ncbi:MAG: hypothetical protein OD814_001505 [Candidatus Alkanophagales archaeon MCA70_species_1]|nr:hypothetical protein [Candidatus Alkanophaga volatiphilum]
MWGGLRELGRKIRDVDAEAMYSSVPRHTEEVRTRPPERRFLRLRTAEGWSEIWEEQC